jgi:hypothetical protein
LEATKQSSERKEEKRRVQPRAETASNTSNIALRVVGGDEKETVFGTQVTLADVSSIISD